MSENDFNSVPLNQRAQVEALVSSQAVTALHNQLTAAQQRVDRLRELLQTYKQRLDARWREGTRVDSYARGYQDGLEAAEVIFDDVFQAELTKGE